MTCVALTLFSSHFFLPFTQNVRSIAAGLFHTVAVTDSDVYSWGCNSSGALGLGDTEDRDLPCKVRSGDSRQWPFITESSCMSSVSCCKPHNTKLQISTLEGQQVSRVSCGSDHTLFLTKEGTVYGCGAGSEGQLTQRIVQMGLPNAMVTTPCKLALPFGVQVSMYGF